MEYFIYIGAAMALFGLVGLGISIKMAFDLKKNNPEQQAAKDKMGLLIAINTASLGLSFLGLALVVVGMLL